MIALGCAPCEMSKAAHMCLRSWNLKPGGTPARSTDGLEVAAVEGVVAHRPTALPGEHQVVRSERSGLDVRGEFGCKRGRHTDLAT